MGTPAGTVTGIEFLAAVMAPWSVSPHPNFASKDIGAHALLAVVAEYRLGELTRHSDNLGADQPEWSVPLAEAARDSLLAGTQASGVDRLLRFARDPDEESASLGARVAAAILATAGLAETDSLPEALDLLTFLIDAVERESQRDRESSQPWDLLVSALNLHSAMRLVELGRTVEAAEFLAAIDEMPRPVDMKSSENFSVSPGISWGPDEVLKDIAAAIQQHGKSLRMRIERFDGRSWVDVVKARPVWIDVRTNNRESRRDARARAAAFEKHSDSLTRKTRFGVEPVPGLEDAYAVALLAELSANYIDALRSREALAQILLLNSGSLEREHAIQESLRLMRQSRSKDGLRTAIAMARTDGPLRALASASRQAIGAAVSRPGNCTFELILLTSAEDLLTASERGEVLTIAARSLQFADDRTRTFEDLRVSLRALLKFRDRFVAPEIAQIVRQVFTDRGESPSIATSEIGSIAEAVDWAAAESERERWTEWAGRLTESDDSELGWRMLEAIGVPHERREREGLALVAQCVNEETDTSHPSAASAAVRAIESEIASARASQRSFGGWDPGEVVTLFALKFGHNEVWSALDDFLTDGQVPRSFKSRAFARLAENAESVPETLVQAVKENWSRILESPADLDFFPEDRSPMFTALLRFGSATGAADSEDVIPALTALVSSADSNAREEAARAIAPTTLAFGAGDWGLSLLLQLSYDVTIPVKCEAVRQLASLHGVQSILSATASQRVHDALTADSVRLPLAVLQGQAGWLQRSQSIGSDSDLPHSSIVREVANGHPSRTVREYASSLLEASEEAPEHRT